LKVEKEEEAEEPVMVEQDLLRFESGKDLPETIRDEVVVEGQIQLYVNGQHHTTFLCLTPQAKELAVGYLVTQGFVTKLDDIKSMEIRGEEVHVTLKRKPVKAFLRKRQLILTSCGSRGLNIPPRLLMRAKKASAYRNFRLNPQIVSKATMELNSRALTFRSTGGTHAAALLNGNGEVVAFSEDIGRHNTLDKVIGKAILEGIDLTRTFLASTGRLTSEMVVKAVYAGVLVMVSISAPTDKAIKIADTAGLTLVGFARGNRFNVYTHPDRILF